MHVEASVLYQQVVEGCRGPLSKNREGHLCSPNLGLMALALLLGALYHYPDRLALKVSLAKIRHLQENHQMGGGTQRIQHALLPMTFHQSPSIG